MVVREADVVVIGAGPGGYAAAVSLAKRGKRVICIEREALGGECLNHGCIPSKAMLKASRLYYKLGSVSDFGICIPEKEFHIKDFQKWKERRVLLKLRKGIEALFRQGGVELLRGDATLKGKREVVVTTGGGEEVIHTKAVVLATGSRPRVLKGFEPDGGGILSARDFLSLQEVPEKAGIIGGGYIGFELAFFLLYLGREVELFEIAPQVLAILDDDLRELIIKKFQGFGGRLHCAVQPKRYHEGVLQYQEAEVTKEYRCDFLLSAVGREVSFSGLGLESIEGLGVNPDGSLQVNECMETTVEGVYAIGDCSGPPFLAHKAIAEAEIVARALCCSEGGGENGTPFVYPYALFTEPEVAVAGKSEKELKREGVAYHIAECRFSSVGISSVIKEPDGFVKIMVEEKTKRIIGAKVAGHNAANLITPLTLAIQQGLKQEELAELVSIHPSQSEGITEAASSLFYGL